MHGVQLGTGFVKVQVNMVHDIFRAVLLEKPPNDEIMTLENVVHTYVQWPKKDITLDPSMLASTQHE